MPYSLDEIKSFQSLDLESFEIRGAKTGVNNARSTGPLYDRGLYNPLKSILPGSVTMTSGDSTVRGISLSDGSYNALNLVEGDTIVIGNNTSTIRHVVDATAAAVYPTPNTSGIITDATYLLTARHYLIEPDAGTNSVNGYATFTQGSPNVTGTGFLDTSAGDALQLNTYQKYFIINNVVSDTSCVLKTAYDGQTASGIYTAKRWRLNRLTYQYIKNDFEYDTQTGRWVYDSTTGGDRTAYASYDPFVDGIDLKFSPTLKPTQYPDLMDSNVALRKILTRSTTYDMFQYPLPAVPNPEESFELFINGVKKVNRKDYVINYSQLPTYQYPPPVDQRSVANILFMNYLQDTTLSPVATTAGVLVFTDPLGNTLQGIMPGTEAIKIDGVVQTPNADYVIDTNSGVGYASTVITNEPVVKHVMYQKKNVYDLGINITLDGTAQQLTIPGSNSDDVIFDVESGRMKPATQDNPGPNDEYIVTYYSEDDYVSDEVISVTTSSTDWVRVKNYPIKPQSVILAKNGEYLDENVDFRVSCLTGRLVFFSNLNLGDSIVVSYSPLIKHVNGLSYRNGVNYTKVYKSETSVNSTNPLSFVFTNPDLLTSDYLPVITAVHNVTRSDATYDITGYKFSGINLELVSNPHNVSIGTETTDVVALTYKFQQDGVEYSPVQTINFTMLQGSNYIVLVDQQVTGEFLPGYIIKMANVDTAGDFYFKISDSIFDGEDTIVYFEGSAPSDITNPAIFISDGESDFIPLADTAYPVMSGSTEIQFPGDSAASEFRPGHLLNIGTDLYYVINSVYDSSSAKSIVTFNVESSQDYTSNLSLISRSDYPYYYEGDTVLSTQYDIIPEPPAPVMALNYNGYATVTKDSSAFSVDIGNTHYTFLDALYPNAGDIYNALISMDFTVNIYSASWFTSKFNTFTDLVVSKDSSTLITGIDALRRDGTDTLKFSTTGGVLTLVDPLVSGQRYDFDYLGQRSLGDSTVVFSGSYFNFLPAKSKVEVSMKYDNLDQFYIQVLNQRQFLEDVIQPEKTEEALQQSGNVGQGGDLQGDDAGRKEQGGLTNDEYRRADASITCNVFDNIFDFFNLRLQSYADEVYALKGWNLCNNDGLLSEEDQENGSSSINRMFPWSDYTGMAPYPITCLTGQSVPYAVAGPKRPSYTPKKKKKPIKIKNAPCRAVFNGSDVTCVTSAAPSYWTKQLRVGDFIRPIDRTVNHTITAIINDSSMVISPPYLPPVYKPFVITSKYPLYDDDGYTGPKIIGTQYEDFGLQDGDVFDIQVDGSDQSYVFQTQANPVGALFPLEGYTAIDVAKILTAALDIKVSVEWIYDTDSAYGYSTGLVARVDGTRNNLITKHGAAVVKLGFPLDSTVFGNNDNTHANPEFVYLNAERADRVTQLNALSNSLGISNKLARPDSDAIIVRNMALDESTQINNEMQVLNRELAALQVTLSEPSMPGYANCVTANTLTRQFMADSSVALIYDQSIFTDYQGHVAAQKWIVNLHHRDSTVVHGKKLGFAWPNYSGTGVTNIMGQTSFAVGIEDNYDRRILDGTVDSTYFPALVFYQDTSSIVDGYWTGFASGYSVDQTVTYYFNSQPLFTLKPYSATFTADVTALSAVTLDWSNSVKSFDFLTYPTIGDLKAAISLMPGLAVSGSSIHDVTSCSDLTSMASTLLAPSVSLFDNSSISLLTITADGTYNFSYKIDASGLGINWDSNNVYLPYSVYGNPWGVYALKYYINTNIPGLDASGASIHDSSNPQGLKIQAITNIPPDATIYSGLRECFLDLWTIDDKNLVDRSSYDNVRIAQLDSRLNYLDVRENQIRNDFLAEEFFMSSDTSSTGNIYDWADNRFNRSVGCEARLKQIEKQIQVSQSGLQINKRFL